MFCLYSLAISITNLSLKFSAKPCSKNYFYMPINAPTNAWLLLQVSQYQSDCSSVLTSWLRLITTLITNSVWSTFWILCWLMKRTGDISSSRKSQCIDCMKLHEQISYRWVLSLLIIVIKKTDEHWRTLKYRN
jgi:hypothetical protein